VKTIRVTQLVWAALLFIGVLFDALAMELVATQTLLAFVLVYVVNSLLTLGRNRIIWGTAVAMPVILTATALVDSVAHTMDQSLYLNSRVVAYVVVVNAFLFMLPCLILLSLFWRHRLEFRTLFSLAADRTA
jgi:hypothetical protein